MAEQVAAGARPFDPDALRSALAAGRVQTDDSTLAGHEVDGLRPKAVVAVRSAEEVSQVLRLAMDQGAAVTPWGGGSKQGVGRPLNRLDIVLKTSALNRVLEIDQGNLTAEVEGGIPLAALQTELAGRGLFFPLDPADGEGATVGGALATNASGPRRLLHRTARDQVLGMSVVLADGTLLHTGGKTVKDVAGYNLTKPLIGSWGTLGVIVAATLRLLPLPEASRLLLAGFPAPESAARAALKVRGSQLLPAAMEIAGGEGGQDGASVTWLLFVLEGHREDVARMEREVAGVVATGGGTVEAVGDQGEVSPLWTQQSEAPRRLLDGEAAAVQVKAAVPMALLGGTISAGLALAKELGLRCAYVGHAGSGIARLTFAPSTPGGEQDVLKVVSRLRQTATDAGGFIVIERGPVAVKRALDALPSRDDYAVMRAIREALNAGNTLNPGKLV